MENIFLEILNMSITASWLTLAVIVLRCILKKAPKSLRVILWAMVGIRLVCPFSFESVLSLLPSKETVSEDILYAQNPTIESGVPVINNAVNNFLGSNFSAEPTNSVNPLQVMTYVSSYIWVIGIAVMLCYTIFSFLRIKKKVAEALLLNENIFICDRIDTPFILGIFRPCIYLPSSMNDEDRELVIAHEKAHISRRDHLWKPLGFLLLTVYWFNPVMWIAYILLCKDIELACDEKVIKKEDIGIKKAYSNALINCSAERKLISACPLAFGETGVKSRIKSVLSYKKPAFWVILVAVIAVVVTGVCFLTDPVTDTETDPVTEPTTDTVTEPDIPIEDKYIYVETTFTVNGYGAASDVYCNNFPIKEGATYKLAGDSDVSITIENVFTDYVTISFSEEMDAYESGTVSSFTLYETQKLDFSKWATDYVYGYTFSIIELISSDYEKVLPTDTVIITEITNSLDSNLRNFIGNVTALQRGSKEMAENFCVLSFAVLGKETKGENTTLYLRGLYKEYDLSLQETVWGFNGPYAVTYKEAPGYELVEYWQPEDGNRYTESIKEKFPESLWEEAIDLDIYNEQLNDACEKVIAQQHFDVPTEEETTILPTSEITPGKCLMIKAETYPLLNHEDPISTTDIVSLEPFDYMSLGPVEDGKGFYIFKVTDTYVDLAFLSPLYIDGKFVKDYKLYYGETLEFFSKADTTTAPLTKYTFSVVSTTEDDESGTIAFVEE